MFGFGRAQPAQPAPTTSSMPSRTVWYAAAIVLVVIVAIIGYGSFGGGPSTSSPNVTVVAPNVKLPKVDGPTAIQIQALAAGPGIDASLKALAMWLDERAIWLAVLVGAFGLLLHATHHQRDLGRRMLWSVGIALVGLLLFPVVVQLIVHLIEARDAAMANGISLPPSHR